MSNTEIISKAYETLSGKWLRVLFPFFIVALIPNLYQPSVNYNPPIYLAFISLFASGPMIYGGSLLALKILRGEDFNFEMIFSGFNHFVKTLLFKELVKFKFFKLLIVELKEPTPGKII